MIWAAAWLDKSFDYRITKENIMKNARSVSAILMSLVMILALAACGGTAPAPAAPAEPAPAAPAPAAGGMDALIEAAKAEGEITVYGSCEEE
jgi:hypothetical protein